MIDLKDLRKFLVDSNKEGYAGGDEKREIKESDGSTTIKFESGKWSTHDNFFGGEPYGGRAVVSFEGKPVWMMVYYGWVESSVKDPSDVYRILRKALMQMPGENPFRGPKKMVDGDFEYKNKWQGGLDRYSGEEVILQSGKQVYIAYYFGGLVDQRGGV